MKAKNIAIFEDEFLLANDLKRQLTHFGFEVSAMFAKAEDGIAYLDSLPVTEKLPDVILVDITLAGSMSGIEAASLISEKYPCAIVFLTGMDQIQVFEKVFDEKPTAFLMKPFDIQQAIVSIQLAIYQKKLETELNELITARSQMRKSLEAIINLTAGISKEITNQPLLLQYTKLLEENSMQLFSVLYG